MPTKPATTYVFATDANFGSGPASGFPTKLIPGAPAQGFIPGDGINAEWVNYLFNVTGQWVTDWLDGGTSAPDLDAHIVETDSGGEASIAGLNLGGTVSADLPLDIASNSGANVNSVHVDHSNTNPAVFVESDDGIGVDVQVDTDNEAARFINFGDGDGVIVLCDGAADADGLIVIAGGLGGDGVSATASADGVGVNSIADQAQAGIFVNDATAPEPVLSLSNGGASPVSGLLHLESSSEPSAPGDDEFWKLAGFSGLQRGFLEYQDPNGADGGGGAGEMRVHASPGGYGASYGSSEGDTTEGAGVLATKLQLLADSGDEFTRGEGKYLAHFKCSVRLGAGAALTTRAVVEFSTTTLGVFDSFEIDFAALGQRKPVSSFVEIDLSGTENLVIQFRTLAGGNDVICDGARIAYMGSYDR